MKPAQWTSMASGTFGCCFIACSIAGCFPRSDLDGYSVGGGAGGTGGDVTPQLDAGSNQGGTSGSEEIDDMTPLVPQADSGAMLGGDMGSSIVPDAGEPGCDGDGTFESGDGQSCYLLPTETAGWLAARDACREWGGDLVKVETLAEHQFLMEQVDVDIWIGANDRETEGTYVWADGAPVTDFNWSMGQPDNFQGQENCVEIRALDQLWNDRPCGGDPQGYLCER